jgi:dTDP-4-amino-4,6-dideoxygalactose transaminase
MLNTKFSPWPSFTQHEADKISEVLLSNKVNYWTGTECRSFEKEFAQYTDCSYAVAVSNGTLALDLAFVALGIKNGDEVIVTSRTFLASVSSIVNCGAIPVFVDISPDTQNITPEAISAAITEKTAAIVCVHLAGWACEMDEIMQIASDNDLFVVEDCAQAHGAKYKGKSVGSIGHVGCWSFCQDKIMTTGGEGGMVTTNDESLWKKMWAYKDHGKSYDAIYHKEHPPGFRWLHESFGTNWRMTEIQGAIGRYQLTQMPLWTQKRNNNQNAIWECAKLLNGLRVPHFRCSACPGCDGTSICIHAAYKCYVFVENQSLNEGWDRDKIIDEVIKRCVPCFSGSCSEVYLEKAFDNTSYRPKERLPVAKELGETSLMFLVHPTLTEEEIKLTCSVLSEVMHLAAKQD